MGHQGLHGLFRRFAACGPVAVVDMIAPDLPIEQVELVLVLRDCGGRLGFPRDDHEARSDLCTAPVRIRVSAATWLITLGQARQSRRMASRPAGRRLALWNRD